MTQHPNGITEHQLGEPPRPNPEGLKAACELIDIAMLCVSNTGLTPNNEGGLRACLKWLSEMKASVAQQLADAKEEGKNELRGCDAHSWYKKPDGNRRCAGCGMEGDGW